MSSTADWAAPGASAATNGIMEQSQEGEGTQRLQLGAHDGQQGDTAGPSDDRIETFGCMKWFPTSAGQRSMQSVGRVAAKPAYFAEHVAIHGTDVAPASDNVNDFGDCMEFYLTLCDGRLRT